MKMNVLLTLTLEYSLNYLEKSEIQESKEWLRNFINNILRDDNKKVSEGFKELEATYARQKKEIHLHWFLEAYLYSLCLQYGIGTEKNLSKTIAICRAIVNLGVNKLNFFAVNFTLGQCYEEGVIHFPKDEVMARENYEFAAKRGFVLAHYKLGLLKLYGMEVQRDPRAAFSHFNKSKKVIKDSLYHLGVCHETGPDNLKNLYKAFKYYEIVSASNHRLAKFKLGLFYYRGIVVAKDEKRGLAEFESPDLADLPEAQFWIAVHFYLLFSDKPEKTHDDKARTFFQKAAEQGHMTSLGVCHFLGIARAQDTKQAMECLKLSAGNEDPVAETFLGDCYLYGKGIPKNLNLAIEWYEKAARRNFDLACSKLAKLFNEVFANQEIFREKRLEKAYDCYSSAANEGRFVSIYLCHEAGAERDLPNEQLTVARCREVGLLNIGKDLKKAYLWYKKLCLQPYNPNLYKDQAEHNKLIALVGIKKLEIGAKLNISEDHYNLGNHYNSLGGEGNLKLAFEHYEKAANPKYYKEGNSICYDAIFYVALSYKYGLGVKKDLTLAIEWYKKDLARIKELSGDYLKLLYGSIAQCYYDNGNSSINHLEEAYGWYEKSGKAESTEAINCAIKIAKHRCNNGQAKLESLLLAVQWFNKIPLNPLDPNYKEIFSCYEDLALTFYKLGCHFFKEYFTGKSDVESSIIKAIDYFNKCIEVAERLKVSPALNNKHLLQYQQYADYAKWNLAVCHLKGMGTSPDPKKGMALFEEVMMPFKKYTHLGIKFLLKQCQVDFAYSQGYINWNLLINHFSLDINQDYLIFQFLLGIIYKYGTIEVGKNISKARDHLSKAANAGLILAVIEVDLLDKLFACFNPFLMDINGIQVTIFEQDKRIQANLAEQKKSIEALKTDLESEKKKNEALKKTVQQNQEENNNNFQQLIATINGTINKIHASFSDTLNRKNLTLDNALNQKQIDELKHLKEYHDYFTRYFTGIYSASLGIATGQLQNTKREMYEYIPKVIDSLGNSIPIASYFTALLNGIITAYAEAEKMKAAIKIADFYKGLTTAKREKHIFGLAQELTLALKKELEDLKDKPAGHLSRIKNPFTGNDADTAIKESAVKNCDLIFKAIVKDPLAIEYHDKTVRDYNFERIICLFKPDYQSKKPNSQLAVSNTPVPVTVIDHPIYFLPPSYVMLLYPTILPTLICPPMGVSQEEMEQTKGIAHNAAAASYTAMSLASRAAMVATSAASIALGAQAMATTAHTDARNTKGLLLAFEQKTSKELEAMHKQNEEFAVRAASVESACSALGQEVSSLQDVLRDIERQQEQERMANVKFRRKVKSSWLGWFLPINDG